MGIRNWMLAALLSVTAASAGYAGFAPHTNYLKFSDTFALPGMTLPAGTYVFEVLAPGGGAWDVVRVSSKDGQHRYLGFTKTVERPSAKRLDAAITFGEDAPGTVPAIRDWYPEGSRTGHRFIYADGR